MQTHTAMCTRIPESLLKGRLILIHTLGSRVQGSAFLTSTWALLLEVVILSWQGGVSKNAVGVRPPLPWI